VSHLDQRLKGGPLRVRNVWSGLSVLAFADAMRRRKRVAWAMDGAVACAALALCVLVARHHALGHAKAVASETVAAVTKGYVDGSMAELFGRDSELSTDLETPERVVSRLKGGARFHVVPNPARSFQVLAGSVRVRVLGTTFSVQQWPSGATQVLVDRGRVEVAWLGGSTILHSGEGGTFPPPDAQYKSDDAAPGPKQDETPADGVAAAPLPSGASRGPARTAGTPSLHKGWRDYAREGQYDKGFDELRSAGVDGLGDEPADLVLAADVARLSGHPEQALQPLQMICDRHPGDRRAPVAAFMLGRVLLDDLDRPVQAAGAFEQARRLLPTGPLAEDALAREVESWERAHRSDKTASLIAEYLLRYPGGRHTAAMQELSRAR
jgi:transmembrane sensor